jgi:MYXO-CTERM domain-containing protein
MNRFALSTAGLASVSLGGIAAAGTVNVTHNADRWLGENDWSIVANNGSTTVALCDGGAYYGSFEYFSYSTNTATSIFGTIWLGLDLAAGDYTVYMTDTYGDGWAWGSFVGGLGVSGDVVSSVYQSMPSTAGSQSSGSYTGFTFTVVPAPGAMALLGLAGLASRRRRRG